MAHRDGFGRDVVSDREGVEDGAATQDDGRPWYGSPRVGAGDAQTTILPTLAWRHAGLPWPIVCRAWWERADGLTWQATLVAYVSPSTRGRLEVVAGDGRRTDVFGVSLRATGAQLDRLVADMVEWMDQDKAAWETGQ